MRSNSSEWRYAWELLRHPAHVVLVGCVLPALAFLTWSTIVAATMVFMELGIVGFGHKLPAFRRMVDERERAIEAQSAARLRSEMLARIAEPHRMELLHLEALADSIRARVSPSREAHPEDCLGIARLLATYVGGAIAYAASRAHHLSTDRDALDMDIASLELKAATARNESLRAIANERLRVAHMRAARWERSRDDLEEMEEQLRLISDLVRLTHENATAPVRSHAFADALGRALASIPEGERTVSELVELLASDPSPEPRILEMGRRALALATAQAGPIMAAAFQPAPP